MARIVRTFTKRICIFLNLVVALLFLSACLNGFLHPVDWWFFSLLGLIFPLLLILVIGFLIFWASFRSRWILVSVITLILGFTNIRVFIGFHFASGFEPEKKEGAIRILTWNVRWFDEQTKSRRDEPSYRGKMLEFIKEQNADILCFQEYLEPGRKANYSNEKAFYDLKYPYHYRVVDYGKRSGRYEVGVAIFSKFPIVDSFQLKYPGPERLRAAESLIYCDINVRGQIIRVFTTHLQSVLFRKKDYQDLQTIKNAEDSIITASKSIVKKLKLGYTIRAYQADLVREHLDESPHPEIICGDFNDVPNSYAYFRIKGDRQDVFVRKGWGVDRTFSHISPTLRIDYILTDKSFKVLQYKRYPLPYSDHFPVVTDLAMPSTSE